MSKIAEEQAAPFALELSELSKQQAEALQLATFINMSAQDTAAYEKRRERIIELCTALGKYHLL